MSAYGTKKKGGDLALQLTFPDVTAAMMAGERRPYGYSSRVEIEKADLPVAEDFQQQYHAEKKRWADSKAMEWVHNNARTRWLMNHNTFGYTQPYASLGQRIFANPSLGNFSDIYAARDDIADHMIRERRGGAAEHKEFERKFFDLLKEAHLEGGLHGGGMWDWFYKLDNWFAETAFGKWLGENGWKLLATAGAQGHMPNGDQLVEKASARQRRVREEAEKLAREERERKELEDKLDYESNTKPSTPVLTPAERKAAAAAAAEKIRKQKADYEAARNKKTGKGGLHGGVLRTAEGQKYGRQLLRDRIAQLNAIEAGRPGVTENPFGPVVFPREPKMDEVPLTKEDERMLQLLALLEVIAGTYEENRDLNDLDVRTLSRVVSTMTEAKLLLIRLSPDFSRGDFNDVLNLLLDAEFLAREDIDRREQGNDGALERTISNLYDNIYAMVKYTEGMFGVINSPRNEKIAKSRNLIKTLGLSGTPTADSYPKAIAEYGEHRRGEVNVHREHVAQNPDNFIGEGRRKRAVRPRKIRGGLEPCTFPEWAPRQAGTNTMYRPGDKVMYKGKSYECVSNTTNPPLRLAPDPNAGKIAPQWKEIPCGNTGKEAVLDPSAIQPVVLPPQESGFDFSTGEAQPFNPPPAAVPHQPYLMPEEPEGKTEKVKQRTPNPLLDHRAFPTIVKFDVDQRIKFGDRQGAYYGEAIGERVPAVPVPIPIEPDGSLVHPGSGYTRPTFPKFAVQKKPSNELKPRQKAPLPMFQDTASGIFSAPRMPNAPVTSVPVREPFSYVGGLTRKTLPKTVEGFQSLAKELASAGHKIAIRPTSKLASIRATFIRKLKL